MFFRLCKFSHNWRPILSKICLDTPNFWEARQKNPKIWQKLGTLFFYKNLQNWTLGLLFLIFLWFLGHIVLNLFLFFCDSFLIFHNTAMICNTRNQSDIQALFWCSLIVILEMASLDILLCFAGQQAQHCS